MIMAIEAVNTPVIPPRVSRRFTGIQIPRTPGQIIAWLTLVFIAFLFIVPLVWMISTSLKTPQDLADPGWIPPTIAWDNYPKAFSWGNWIGWTVNTVIIT